MAPVAAPPTRSPPSSPAPPRPPIQSRTAEGITPQPVPVLWKPGDLKAHAGAAVEAGWLTADGRAVSRKVYAALYAAIGTGWGAGDGATTFNLPDYTDRMILGVSATRPLGTIGGEAETELEMQHMPEHDHQPITGRAYYSGFGTTLGWNGSHGIAGAWGSNSSGTIPPSRLALTAQGEGAPHNNMPPFAAALVIIKT